ncbi:hypothetical protein Zmor_006858 [Zophobas morio]|uniref:Uncharacterized protein n=1 Tax=Zophobas morio TaxID=2755281 RepID=A0AA38MNY4_9CUCU|nr:hypothetical protein Zmor_006858 [Zophobas morio]
MHSSSPPGRGENNQYADHGATGAAQGASVLTRGRCNSFSILASWMTVLNGKSQERKVFLDESQKPKNPISVRLVSIEEAIEPKTLFYCKVT